MGPKLISGLAYVDNTQARKFVGENDMSGGRQSSREIGKNEGG